MRKSNPSSKVVWYVAAGFGSIIALSWADELADLPHLLFGSEHHSNWYESLLETFVVVLVAIPVLILTKRLVSRLHYLDEFLILCSWCRKLNLDGQWVPVEEYFQSGYEVKTSHGICPICAADFTKNLVKR
jgi:hypothetical protein